MVGRRRRNVVIGWACVVVLTLLGSRAAHATFIDFDDAVVGEVLDTKYASLGVTFVGMSGGNVYAYSGGTAYSGHSPLSDPIMAYSDDTGIRLDFSSVVQSLSLYGVDYGGAFPEDNEIATLAALSGYDTFRRRKVGEAWEEDDEAAWNLFREILLPSWAGGRTQKRLQNQMETGVDRFGNKLNKTHTWMDAALGMVVQTFRHNDEKRKLALEYAGKLGELSRGVIKTKADKSVSKKEKSRRMRIITERLERLKEDYQTRMRAIVESEKQGE